MPGRWYEYGFRMEHLFLPARIDSSNYELVSTAYQALVVIEQEEAALETARAEAASRELAREIADVQEAARLDAEATSLDAGSGGARIALGEVNLVAPTEADAVPLPTAEMTVADFALIQRHVKIGHSNRCGQVSFHAQRAFPRTNIRAVQGKATVWEVAKAVFELPMLRPWTSKVKWSVCDHESCELCVNFEPSAGERILREPHVCQLMVDLDPFVGGRNPIRKPGGPADL